MQRTLIVLGLLLLLIGLTWQWLWPLVSGGLSKIPFGRLPGDIVIERPGFRFYFPLTSLVILSLILSFILWLFRK